jgi:hypothetical protein
MTAKAVEWVLVVYYGPSAHRATYGRLPGNKYTKDYIQLWKRTEFIDDLKAAFPSLEGDPSISITYRWPKGSAEGKVVRESADRPHLAWDTNRAPDPWRMLNDPTESTAQTIRGNPSRTNEQAADDEYNQLISSGFGQPFLVAVKLKDEATTLHLQVQIENPESQFKWADLLDAPPVVRELAASTSKNSTLAWRLFNDGELYFDPDRKGNSWAAGGGPTNEALITSGAAGQNQAFAVKSELDSDLLAEGLARSDEEISEFKSRIESDNYEVPDATSTVKTRGSAQKAFADNVKKNYESRCALSGVKTPAFLIASHIVPWSVDQTIRLDPSNGICLSVFIDRAFEKGFIVIQDDGTVTVDFDKIGDDTELRKQLERYDGVKLSAPRAHPPKAEYLKRRRGL